MVQYNQLGRASKGGSNATREFASVLGIMNYVKPLNPEIKVLRKDGVTLRFIYTPKGAEVPNIITIKCSKSVQEEIADETFDSGLDALKFVATKYPVQVIRSAADGTEYDTPVLRFASMGTGGEDVTLADLAKLFKNEPQPVGIGG